MHTDRLVMSQYAYSFRRIDYILITIGCKLYPASLAAKIVNRCLLFLAVSFSAAAIIQMIIIFSGEKTTYWEVLYLFIYTSVLINIGLIKKKGDRIKEVHESCFDLLDASSRKAIQAYSLKLAVIYHSLVGLVTGIFISIFVNDLFWTPNEKIWQLEAFGNFFIYGLYSLGFPLFCSFWFLTSLSLYKFLLYEIRMLELQLISQFANDIQTIDDISVMKNFLSPFERISALKRSFETLMNIFPLHWFSIFFIRSTTLVLGMKAAAREEQENFVNTYGWLILEIVCYLVTMALTFQVYFLNDELNERISWEAAKAIKLCRKLPLHANYELIGLLEDLKRSDLKLTAFSMIELNKSYLLSFLGSVVTFTVLFIQISQNAV